MNTSGPGKSNMDNFVPQISSLLGQYLLPERDIVIVELRGLRYSKPFLKCDELIEVRILMMEQNLSYEEAMSCTKSFTSTVLGLLIDDKITQLNTFAQDIIPKMAETYPNVTLLHFTTMTSGYLAAGDTVKKGYTHGPSRTPFTPSTPSLFEPGTKYAYWDAAMNQFANILTHIAKESLDGFFKHRIADPIGMNENNWYWGDFGDVNGLKVVGGAGNQSKGIYISANELARFGLLFLNEGNWNGNQLISRDWIRQSTRVQVLPILELGTHLSEIYGMGVYGFNWWVNGVQPNGNRLWPNAPASTYAASGYNNNKMFIIPEWDMVIVRLGLDAIDG